MNDLSNELKALKPKIELELVSAREKLRQASTEVSRLETLLETVSLQISAPEKKGETLLDAEPKQVRERPPRELVLRDGSVRSMKHWKDLVVEVCRSLVADGLLTAADCPISKVGSSEKLVTIGRPNPSHSYTSPTEIGSGLMVETHGSAWELWERACFIVRRVGGKPESFGIVR